MKRMIGLVMMMGLVVGVGCGGDKDSPTGPSNEVTKGPDGQTLEVVTRKWENGNIKVESQYFKDIEGKMVQHGYYKEYYESGKVKREENIVDGKREGKSVLYYESGKVEWEENYVDGKLEGKSVWYYESGEVEREVNYVDGNKDGKWVYYYESGEVKRERNYVDGKREGKWVDYDEEGNITRERCWEMGEEVDCPKDD